MTRDLVLAAAILIGFTACAPNETGETPVTQTAAAPVISYSDAFVMEPIGGRDMTMGGVSLSVAEAGTRLIAASSPDFGTIELHTMQMVDGKMQMRQVEGFDIAAGETLTLQRGGNHLMMFDVGEGVIGGETVDLTLEFANGDEAPITLVVPATVRVVGE